MHTISILEPDIARHAELRCTLQAACRDWELVFTTTAGDALQSLDHQVDVLVAPDSTPDGSTIDLFSEARKIHASTIRIVLIGKQDSTLSERFSRLTNRMLARQSTAESLIATISAAIQLRAVMTNERLRRLVLDLPTVPTLPETYQEIQAELRRDQASLQSISNIISADPALTARILQLANSACFGLPTPVSVPMEAINYLGINTVSGLVLTHGVFSQFDQRTIRSVGLRDVFWRCSVMGRIAQTIMQGHTTDKTQIGHAMTAGILCDIGTLLLAAGMPEVMAISKRMREKENRPDWDVENDLIGFTHMQVGAMLLSTWNLPDSIVEAVAYHHCPSHCPETQFSTLTAVHVSNAILMSHSDSLLPNLDWPHIQRVGATESVDAWHKLPESMQLTSESAVHV